MNNDAFVETILDGRFSRCKARLGSGAYKTVFKGYDHENGIEVAWNQIKFERLKQTERDRLNDEIRILQVIEHPNIIKLYQFYVDEEKKRLVILTELMTSGTLRQFVLKSHQPTKLKVIKRWCTQILKGLSYLHSQNIIHRDLKCDNIFINGSMGEVKIGDLGLSTTMNARTHAESVIGTPEFMAPEFYDEHYTEKVDTYAFGMCLLEMVTQEYPYSECTNAAQIYKKVTGGRPPGALLRIEDCDVRQFIELCIGSIEDRPSPSELLDHKFFSHQGPSDSDPVRMRPEDPEAKLLNAQGIVDGPAAPPSTNSSTSLPSPTSDRHFASGAGEIAEPEEPPQPAAITPAAPAASPAATASQPVVPADPKVLPTDPIQGVMPPAESAERMVPPAESAEQRSQRVPPAEPSPTTVPAADGAENADAGEKNHNFHVGQPGPKSERTPMAAGEQEIKLQLLIGDVVKEVSFPFNVETDTAAEVANEMVADLKLKCEISWLTGQLEERVSGIPRSAIGDSDRPSSPPSWGAAEPGEGRLHSQVHDSPRISARTVPSSERQLDIGGQPRQMEDNSWLITPPIDMSQPSISETDLPPAGTQQQAPDEPLQTAADSSNNSNNLADGAGSRRSSTQSVSQTPKQPAAESEPGLLMPADPAVEQPDAVKPPEAVVLSTVKGEDEGVDSGSSGLSSPLPQEAQGDSHEAQEFALLEELSDIESQIKDLNQKIVKLNTARSLVFDTLQAHRSKAQEAHDKKSLTTGADNQAAAAEKALPEKEKGAVTSAVAAPMPGTAGAVPAVVSVPAAAPVSNGSSDGLKTSTGSVDGFRSTDDELPAPPVNVSRRSSTDPNDDGSGGRKAIDDTMAKHLDLFKKKIPPKPPPSGQPPQPSGPQQAPIQQGARAMVLDDKGVLHGQGQQTMGQTMQQTMLQQAAPAMQQHPGKTGGMSSGQQQGMSAPQGQAMGAVAGQQGASTTQPQPVQGQQQGAMQGPQGAMQGQQGKQTMGAMQQGIPQQGAMQQGIPQQGAMQQGIPQQGAMHGQQGKQPMRQPSLQPGVVQPQPSPAALNPVHAAQHAQAAAQHVQAAAAQQPMPS